MSLETNSFEFGKFLLDPKEKVLLGDGKPISITPKAFQLLQILVENHGHLVERDKLLNTVWADSFVEEGNLTFTIRLLRKALADDKQNPRFIETVPKSGYRFVAEVREIKENASPAGKEKLAPLLPTQKPYFLIAIGIISLISIFGIAFVWFNGENFSLRKRTKLTRLTNGGKVTNTAVSPSGEYLVFAQKEGLGESLWVRHLTTGKQSQILPPQEVEFVGLTVSPDNNYVYYSVFSNNAAILTLLRISLEGSSAETLADVATDISVSFSPDGKKFAFTEGFSSLKETHLKIADADGTNQQALVKAKSDKRIFPAYKSSPVAWSPDGQTIACVVQEFEENGSSYKILLVNPNDGSEKYLSERRWDAIENIVWKDAGNLALINQPPNLPINQIWEISRANGEAKQLTKDSNSYQWLGSSQGNLFTIQKNIFSSLHVANFAENTNTFQSNQIFGEAGSIENAKWSLDGKIYYNSWTSGKNEIWQINADGTTPQQLTVNSNLVLSFAVSPIDNGFVFSTLQDGKVSLARADSNGHQIRQLTDGTIDISPSFAPDGKTIVFQKNVYRATLWQIGIGENTLPLQLTGYYSTNPAISPDGQQIAYHFMDYGGKNPHWKLGLIDSESHKLLNKLEFPFPITARTTVWYPKNNLLTIIFSNGEDTGILFLSAIDGKFQTINKIASGRITSFDWSSDGSHFVFSESFETSDVILIKDAE